jgi:hypothetical protein
MGVGRRAEGWLSMADVRMRIGASVRQNLDLAIAELRTTQEATTSELMQEFF